MFLATFIICLREGLEASLIVGILAAFLKRSHVSLKPLLVAVAAAVAISIAVGVGLMLATQALPQAQQEALETVIGIVAVVFVTTMIVWMNANAHSMRGSLEQSAESSLSRGGAVAMAWMAFLSVLKEGFETAVFLLAVFQAASGGVAIGLVGAVVGLALAIVIGVGIYYGGSHFNIGTFFKVTGPFLIAVAAGFVLNVFRTEHEAGWVNIGQQQVFDFSGLLSNDSVVGALITGVFSIPSDPRLIEVIAWCAYFIPVMVVYLWPRRWAFSDRFRIKFKAVSAGVLLVAALVLFVAVPRPSATADSWENVGFDDGQTARVELVSIEGDAATLQLVGDNLDTPLTQFTLERVSEGSSHGIPLVRWEGKMPASVADGLPETVSLNDLLALNGGQLPSGISLERTPGPFAASWEGSVTVTARTSGSNLIEAAAAYSIVGSLSGGGISGTKTVTADRGLNDNWSVSEEDADAALKAIEQDQLAYEESSLYWGWIPTALVLVAVGIGISLAVDRRRATRVKVTSSGDKSALGASGY